jgi:hypothetical protein
MRKLILMTYLITTTMFNIFGQGKDKSEKEFNKIKSRIFPVVKVETSGESGKTMEFTAENQPVFKKIAGDLLCFYGIMDDLDNIAKENLLEEVQRNLKIHKTDFGRLGFTCGGNHEAALILLPEIWGVLIEKLGENIVFGVPAKDMSVFVNADQTDSVSKLQEMINDIHKDGSRLLSKKLFKYKAGQIEVN